MPLFLNDSCDGQDWIGLLFFGAEGQYNHVCREIAIPARQPGYAG